MDADQLQAFVRIAQDGSFSRAAWSLGIAQPTISARIRALEAAIGGPLFTRGGRRSELSELGQAFLPYARRTLEIVREGVDAARAAQAGQAGTVRLGVTESHAEGFIATAVAAFHATHPEVELVVHTDHSDGIIQSLHDGVFHLGVITWPYLGKHLTQLARFKEDLIAVAWPGHPLLREERVSLADLVERASPFLFVMWGASFVDLFERAPRRPGAILDVPMMTARRLAREGIGVTILPESLVAGDIAARRLRTLAIADAPSLHRHTILVRPAGQDRLGAVGAAFVEALVAAAGSMVEDGPASGALDTITPVL